MDNKDSREPKMTVRIDELLDIARKGSLKQGQIIAVTEEKISFYTQYLRFLSR